MKKSILYLSIMAALAASCSVREATEPMAPADHTVLFVAETQDPGTRTAFGPGEDGIYLTRWTDRDTAVAVSLNLAAPREARVLPDPGYRSARFEYTVSAQEAGQADEYSFFLLNPSSAAEAMSPSRKAWKIRIPGEQTPLQNSPDEAAQIFSAATGPLTAVPLQLDVRFTHVTAYGRLTLLNLPEGTNVRSITLSCTAPLSGSWYFSTETSTLEPLEPSTTLVLRTSATENVWFACAPGDVSGATLKVIVDTDLGTIEKAVTLHANRSFKPGRVASFSVDFTGIRPGSANADYTLVTDASSLRAGDEILLLNQQGTQAVSTTQKSKYRVPTPVTVREGKVVNPSSEIQRFVLDGTSGAWNIRTPEGLYLYTKEGSENSLKTSESATPIFLSDWTISITSNGAATIAAPYAATTDKRYMMYRADNEQFSTFVKLINQGSLMSIYRKDVNGDHPYEDDPVLAYEEYGAYRNGNNRIYVPGTDQLSREYARNAQTLTFAILSPADGTVLELDGIPVSPLVGDTFSLLCRERQGIFSEENTYTVTILRVDGAKVWLSDGKGKGFIVKK